VIKFCSLNKIIFSVFDVSDYVLKNKFLPDLTRGGYNSIDITFHLF